LSNSSSVTSLLHMVAQVWLEYGESFRQATVQQLPKAFQDCIEPTVAKQVMQLCGLTPLQIHEAGVEWLALTREQIQTAVARNFFTEASASELERYYAAVAVGGYTSCDEQFSNRNSRRSTPTSEPLNPSPQQ
jgi:hypothetical protein